jgi:ATP-dependent DNA helicase RecG
VQCGRFIGTDKAQIFVHIDIREHLPTAVDSVMLFLKKHAMRGADFSAVRRKDVWSIPLLLLREAVINALVHADYSQSAVRPFVCRSLTTALRWRAPAFCCLA